ncbi:hypothetical protein [Jannaschia sp. R86511]|uniref:hypothetical protein n=1 Tax=Jannaschia sp. R86511 TaxID=3093853 RepID=UPI0036D25690
MTDDADSTTGSGPDPGPAQPDTSPQDPGAYRAEDDADADPDVMNPRDLRGAGSGETDPDLDPDSLNPREGA